MKILIYSFNDKIGDGLQKITFIQSLKKIYPKSQITYTTTNTTTLRNQLSPLVHGCIDKFIEYNHIDSSITNLFKKNKIFSDMYFDLIIDLQKVVIRTLKLKQIKHKFFFSAAANFLFSDYKNKQKLVFKNLYIEQFYFNIIELITNQNDNFYGTSKIRLKNTATITLTSSDFLLIKFDYFSQIFVDAF